MAKRIRTVDISKDIVIPASPHLVKDGGVYVAPLASPLVVQTSVPITLTSDLQGDFAMLELPSGGDYVAFFKAAEATILQQCVAHRGAWFKDSATDETLVAAFKSFVDGQTLKVRIADEALAFDQRKEPIDPVDIPSGTHVRVVLELSRACFGKTTFGAMWKLVQIQALPSLACLFKDGNDEPPLAPPQEEAEADGEAEAEGQQAPGDGDDESPDAREFA